MPFYLCKTKETTQVEKLFVFNPEMDLALAFGGPNYTAPPFAARLRCDLQVMPMWYACGQPVLADPGRIAPEWLDAISLVVPNRFAAAEQVVERNDTCHDLTACPWGWSAAIRRQLHRQLHFPRLRTLFHRNIAGMRRLLGLRLV